MSHTFEGESCVIHYNGDMSGSARIRVPRVNAETVKGYQVTDLDPDHEVNDPEYVIVSIEAKDLLSFLTEYVQRALTARIESMTTEEVIEYLMGLVATKVLNVVATGV